MVDAVDAGPTVVPDWFSLRVGLEATASRIRSYEPEYVHGMVQTEEYATAVFRSDPRLPADVVQQRVRFRMERQERLAERDPAVPVLAVVGESALRRLTGSSEIMAAQIAHLRSSADHPHVEVRVLPFSAGLVPHRGSFTLLDFADEEDPAVAHVEMPLGSRYLDRHEDRAEYEYVFDLIASRSISIDDWSPG